MNRSTIHRFASFLSAALLLSSLPSAAQVTAVPDRMSYQAYVTDDNNVPLAAEAPRNYQVIFRIYDSATGNTVLWAEKQMVTIYQGNFSVLLGGGQVVGGPWPGGLPAVFTGDERYIGVEVDPHPEFEPRQRILASAYAYRAQVAESVGGVISLSGTSTNLTGGFTANEGSTINGSLKLAGAGGSLTVDGFTNLMGFRSDANSSIGGDLFVSGALDFNGAMDVSGTTNLDVVDIDGAVQMDATFTLGVNDAGYDVKFFGDTADAYMLWDTATDDLILKGAAGLDVDGDTDLDVVDMSGAVTMGSTVTLSGNADFNGELDVLGTTNLDAVDIDGAVHMAQGLIVGGETTLKNRLLVGTRNLGPGVDIAQVFIGKGRDEGTVWGNVPNCAMSMHGAIFAHGSHLLVGPDIRMAERVSVTGQLLVNNQDIGASVTAIVDVINRLSDERLKKNVQNLEDGVLDKILKLRPVTFEYDFDPKHPLYRAGKQTGFVAQEVEKLFPEWVTEYVEQPLHQPSKNDEALAKHYGVSLKEPLALGPVEGRGRADGDPPYKALRPKGFEALAVQALRELRAEKDGQIETLKEANGALEARLTRLETLLEKRLKESN